VHLPPAIITAVRLESPDAQRAFFAKRLRAANSPVSIAHLVMLSAQLADLHPRYARLARRLMRSTLSPAWSANLDIMRFVAGHAMQEFADFVPDSALAPTDSGSEDAARPGTSNAALLVASWYHAHRFVAAINSTRADLGEIAHWLDALEQQAAQDLFARPQRARDADLAHPRLLSEVRFVVRMLQELASIVAFAKDVPQLIRTLEASFTHDVGGEGMLHVHLLRDLQGLPDRLRTFVQPIRDPDGALNIGQHVLATGKATPLALLDDALATLEQDPFDIGSWLAVTAVAGSEPLTGDRSARMREVIASLDIADVLDRLAHAPLPATQRIAVEVSHQPDSAARQRAREMLIAAAAKMLDDPLNAGASRTSGDVSLSKAELAIVDALYTVARGETSTVGSMRVFVADLARLARIHVKYLDAIRGTVERLALARPLTEAQVFLPLLFEARGSASGS
jgi:hypothetical protein